jgi:NitT/TauT family transport system substrate-binding protein
VFQTEDFKGATPVALESWVDFSVADAVLEDLGVSDAGDTPSR